MIRKKNEKKTARELDRERLVKQKKKKSILTYTKKEIKRTTIHTMPYECFVSDYVMLLKSNVRVGNDVENIYSKTYLLPDANYSFLTEEEQLIKMQEYMNLLNGFDSSISLQLSILNTEININEFENTYLIKEKDDNLNQLRSEINSIMYDKMKRYKNSLRCRKYLTVTVVAVDYDIASTRFFNIEAHMNNCLAAIGTEIIVLNANERVRLLADILRDPNDIITTITHKEFARREEKMLCCPDYFEFKKDYFMYNDKFARCIYFRRLPSSITDSLYKEMIELNMQMIITQNIEFVDPDQAVTMLKRKLTDMKQEEIVKTRKAASVSKVAFVDPIEGSQLAEDKANAQEFLNDLSERNQKMTLCQFIVVVIADSYEEMIKNTEALEILLRKFQIDAICAPYRQEQAFASALPIGNSISYDKDHNLQVRRTLSSESTAVFIPFNSRQFSHENGIWYGQNQMSYDIVKFDRLKLKNANGLIFGVPGSGKSMAAKLEMLYSVLSTDDDVIILDPEREYVSLVEMLGGEIINISINSPSHINPMTLTPNPDPTDKDYDPIKAKYDFLLSFFSAVLGNKELSPIQKTIIDRVMISTYKKYEKPTLKEYYDELEYFEKETADEDIKSDVAYLKQSLHLYVFGSLEVFSHESNVNINKRIVVYDIKDLGKNLQSLGMMITLENIWDRVASNRVRGVGTRIYIDEMYLLFKSEQSAHFFYELYKRARKWGGIPTGITQNVDDLLRSELAKTMISNTQFVMMLSQNATDRIELAKLLHISNETMKYVTNSRAGSGLIFTDEYGCIPFEHVFSTDSHIYQLVTTKFKENIDIDNS